MYPIADSPYARDVAAWVAGGDQTAFTDALAAHEKGSWGGGHTGYVDESLATFDHQEHWIARCLAREGTTSSPCRRGRSPVCLHPTPRWAGCWRSSRPTRVWIRGSC